MKRTFPLSRPTANDTGLAVKAGAATIQTTAALVARAGSELGSRVQWATAAPLWSAYAPSAGDRQKLRAPALLTFASDTFMEDLIALVHDRPEELVERVAKGESFRELPRPGLKLADKLGKTDADLRQLSTLKLYQSAHGHFNLVAASLICRAQGLPDRKPDGAGETVGFVLRRFDPASATEWAWVTGSDNKTKSWVELVAAGQLAKAGSDKTVEDVQALFPVNYCDRGQNRQLWLGLVPTSSRETYKAGALLSAEDEALLLSDRLKLPVNLQKPSLDELEGRVLKRLEAFENNSDPPDKAFYPTLKTQQQDATRFILLDLLEWLSQYRPNLIGAFETPSTANLDADETAVITLFKVASLNRNDSSGDSLVTWFSALQEIWNKRAVMYQIESGPLAAYNFLKSPLLPGHTPMSVALRDKIHKLVPPPTSNNPLTSADLAQGVDPPNLPALDAAPGQTSLFVIRCVFRRPDCPDLLSEPSQPFTLANFFDADAPARPVHISLPLDTSIAGLRKHKKNVSFVMSKQLRKQLDSVTSLKDAMDGKLAAGQEFDLGMICSLSIPIITLCAFIVLMIFLVLLNLVFWWLPFLKICFPIKR